MASGKSNYKEVFKKAKIETPKKINAALQSAAVTAISKMIDRTPVKTGAARNHWFVRLVPNERFDPDDVDPTGTQPKVRAKRDVKLFRIGTKVWLVNSAPYMQFLEKGSSGRKPGGIVAITEQEMASIFKNLKIQTAFPVTEKYK